MTEFERKIRQELLDCVEEAVDGDGVIRDETLCEYAMNEVPYPTLRAMQDSGLFVDLEDSGFANMGNIIKNDKNEELYGTWGYYSKESLVCFEGALQMYKGDNYAGDIIIRAKYNSTEDCDDLITYKFVPDGVDEETVEFIVFHG